MNELPLIELYVTALHRSTLIRYRLYDAENDFAPLAYANLVNLKVGAAIRAAQAALRRAADALSALYPRASEEKRLLDAMLLAAPREN